MKKRFPALLCALALMLSLCACQTKTEQPKEEPLAPAIEFVRTSIQVQSDNSYAVWEHTADQSKLRLSTYNAQGYLQYRIDYHYDEQGRVTVEQTLQLLEDMVSTLAHTKTYTYSGSDVTVAVSDFSYEGGSCKYTMADPANRVTVKDVTVSDGKMTGIVLEELDKDNAAVNEQNVTVSK